jgi:4-hydroxybenzoate polyprenyltransferase
VNNTSIDRLNGLPRWKLLLALSRTPHGILDMATPGLAAVLCLGALPSPGIMALGLLTAFAGYTAVYALNDVVDYRTDREKIRRNGPLASGNDLDTTFVRHPMAQGALPFRDGILWTAGWAALALAGALLLNPICAIIFLAGCVLEALYCLLLRVSYLRTIVSGFVKTSGGLAAVFAVDPQPGLSFLVIVFLWLFFWEIGGQNVPNDWADLREDGGLQARTLPVQLGPQRAIRVIQLCLALTVALSLFLYWATPAPLRTVYLAAALLVGTFFLLVPAHSLRRTLAREEAAALFNRASYYPLAMLLVVVVSALI